MYISNIFQSMQHLIFMLACIYAMYINEHRIVHMSHNFIKLFFFFSDKDECFAPNIKWLKSHLYVYTEGSVYRGIFNAIFSRHSIGGASEHIHRILLYSTIFILVVVHLCDTMSALSCGGKGTACVWCVKSCENASISLTILFN